jgi:hypothetical protein
MSRLILRRLPDSVAPCEPETAVIDTQSKPLTASPTTLGRISLMSQVLRSRTAGVVLTAAIVGLTLATAYIHFGLGSLLFQLNGLGYAGLAALIVVGAAAPMPIVQRFAWFPRLALVGYAAMTIAGYLVMGPYFTLGWIAKGIEVALIAFLVVDVIRVYGSPMGLVRNAIASVAPVLPERIRALAA